VKSVLLPRNTFPAKYKGYYRLSLHTGFYQSNKEWKYQADGGA